MMRNYALMLTCPIFLWHIKLEDPSLWAFSCSLGFHRKSNDQAHRKWPHNKKWFLQERYFLDAVIGLWPASDWAVIGLWYACDHILWSACDCVQNYHNTVIQFINHCVYLISSNHIDCISPLPPWPPLHGIVISQRGYLCWSDEWNRKR